jgi:hypothetical protein
MTEESALLLVRRLSPPSTRSTTLIWSVERIKLWRTDTNSLQRDS